MNNVSFPDNSLLKSNTGVWYYKVDGDLNLLTPIEFEDNPLLTMEKAYYSPEEVKARGMRWVTIRGARVLLQGTADGGYVVVGGAGGKLNHLKIDNVLSQEDYANKRKEYAAKQREETANLSKEEIKEAVETKKRQRTARKEAKDEYTSKIAEVIGMSVEDLKDKISTDEMDAIEKKARDMVEIKAQKKTMSTEEKDKEIADKIDSQIGKAVQSKVKDIERQALDTLMSDYMPDDPNARRNLKELLDSDKAMEVLAARKEFKKNIKEIGKESADIPTDLKVGAVFAGSSSSDTSEIIQEVKDQIETSKNIEMYDMLNAQSPAVNKYIDEGIVSSLNGLVSDVYGSDSTFTTDSAKVLGVEALSRAVATKIKMDGKGEDVRKALEEYISNERLKTVNKAVDEASRRFNNAENLRELARDTDDAEAILSMASANGHALKQLTAGQRALGTAVGSLRSAVHLLNALEDPISDVIQVDMGTDLSRARDRAKMAGLNRSDYSIKTAKRGRGKRLVMELKKENIDTFFNNTKQNSETETEIDAIKSHKMNDGYIPPGFKDTIKLDASQEAGLRFFKKQGKVLLDFEAGLGKTATAYAGIMDAIANNGAKKILVVAPSGPAGDFFSQRETFLTPEMQKIVKNSAKGNAKKRKEMHMAPAGDNPMIHIVTQDSLRQDSSILKDAGYDMVVVDEIHEMTAGTGSSGRYKALGQLADVPLKIGMSGTNIKNKKEELYRKINFIDPSHTLGSMSEFSKKYKGLNQGTGMFSDASNDALRKNIGNWAFTQKNSLPVKNTVVTERVPMTSSQRKKYAESERQYREDRKSGVKGASARRDSRNYKAVTNGESQYNAKVNRIVDIMNKDHSAEKAVIHISKPGSPILDAMRTTIGRLEGEYGKGSVGVIDGSTSASEMKRVKEAFNDPDSSMRFIIGTKTLESGHNLQGGGTVTFHLDVPDSQAAFDQRNARVFRKGQDRDTSTYVLSGNNPLDMRAEDIMETKRKEMGIMGNPRGVSGMDDTGFFGLLKKYETEGKESA